MTEQPQATAVPSALSLSHTAGVELRRLLAEQPSGTAVRITAHQDECAMRFDAEVAEEDHVLEGSGIRLVLDVTSLVNLYGSVLHFQEGMGFTFINAGGGCCGGHGDSSCGRHDGSSCGCRDGEAETED